MAQATASQQASRRSPLESFIDRIWRFFCSVRAAVAEIALLALLVLIGTLRGSSVPREIANLAPPLEPLVERWYDWDVFHSLIFTLLCAVIAIAIAVCTINRVPGIWKSINDPAIRTNQAYLQSGDTGATWVQAGDAPATASALLGELSKQRYRVMSEDVGDDVHIYADRNRYGKFGTFPFHLALILIMVGGIVGSELGFRENQLVIPEGSVREVGHGTGLSVRLDQFNDSWREEGIPAEYRSDLTVLKNGEEVDSGSITVNHPLTHGMVTFYQASFGQAVSLRITDANGNVLFDDSAALGQYTSATNPDAAAALIPLPQVNAQLSVIGPDDDRANAPELDELNLQSGQMYLQLVPTGGGGRLEGVVDQGDSVTLDNINVEFLRERRYTVLQVASNPGMPIFWTAAFLLVGGLAVTFYFPHRRIRGIISSLGEGENSAVKLAPMARRDWSGKRDFVRTVEKVAPNLGVAAKLRTAESTGDAEEQDDAESTSH